MKKTGKYRELLYNIGTLILGNFGSKLLMFFLVPLYTSVLTREDFGNYDIIFTTISLLFPILTLNITEGALRFLLEKDRNIDTICKKSMSVVNSSIVIISLLTIVNKFLHLIPILETYALYFVLFYIAFAYYISAQNIARGFERIKEIATAGIANTILLIALNILFLLNLKLGINGYFLAGIIANILSALYLIIKCKITKYIFNIGYRKPKSKGLVKYSKPLMINSLSWWINDVSDRYIVTWICGSAINGVYSIAYKVPTILSLVHSIFNQAWLISVTKEYKQNKNKGFVANTYAFYNYALLISGSVLLLINRLIATILYKGEFHEAWQFTPFLIIAAIFSAISSAIGVIFGAEKNSRISARTTAMGAVLNIVMNLALIPAMGAQGAAIATAIASFGVWLSRLIYCKRYIKIKVEITDVISYIIIIAQAICCIYLNGIPLYATQIASLIAIFILKIGIAIKIFKGIARKRRLG